MSLYNMLFGMNGKSEILLAVLGLRKVDIERFRDVFVEDNLIKVYTRTGGGNRDDYPQETMRGLEAWESSTDDSFDSTYCTDAFKIPAAFVEDVRNLDKVLEFGIRPQFAQHLSKTLERPPTEVDIQQKAYDDEAAKLSRTKHFMANGHTFVPQDDYAMRTALTIAEQNNGELRTCWEIQPLVIEVKQNYVLWPSHSQVKERQYLERVVMNCLWEIDLPYWHHCLELFKAEFPISMAKIAKSVEHRLSKEREK